MVLFMQLDPIYWPRVTPWALIKLEAKSSLPISQTHTALLPKRDPVARRRDFGFGV